jgi:copper chaperone CopZ
MSGGLRSVDLGESTLLNLAVTVRFRSSRRLTLGGTRTMPTSRTALPVSSRVCGGECQTVERILLDVEGVIAASMNPASEMAYVEYDPTRTDPEALFAVLKRSGFAPADRDAVRSERKSTRAQKITSQGGSV